MKPSHTNEKLRLIMADVAAVTTQVSVSLGPEPKLRILLPCDSLKGGRLKDLAYDPIDIGLALSDQNWTNIPALSV